jgi:hypothetical protein
MFFINVFLTIFPLKCGQKSLIYFLIKDFLVIVILTILTVKFAVEQYYINVNLTLN